MTTFSDRRVMRLKMRVEINTEALQHRLKHRLNPDRVLRIFYREGIKHHCQEIRDARLELAELQ